MTTIRIEHADTRNKYNVTIEVWETNTEGKLVKIKDIILDKPSEMVNLHPDSTRHYIVKETAK